jgi:hypothetical protein
MTIAVTARESPFAPGESDTAVVEPSLAWPDRPPRSLCCEIGLNASPAGSRDEPVDIDDDRFVTARRQSAAADERDPGVRL